jgi:hypothetical protein
MFSVSMSRAFFISPDHRGFIPALGIVWENGGKSAQSRGADASLSLQRIAASIEGRFAPRPEVYVVARVMPGLLLGSATVRDDSAPADLGGTFSAFGVDASAGLGVRLTPVSSPVGLWLAGDAGYSFAPARDLSLKPRLPPSDLQKAGTLDLGPITTNGLFTRFWVALSY